MPFSSLSSVASFAPLSSVLSLGRLTVFPAFAGFRIFRLHRPGRQLRHTAGCQNNGILFAGLDTLAALVAFELINNMYKSGLSVNGALRATSAQTSQPVHLFGSI